MRDAVAEWMSEERHYNVFKDAQNVSRAGHFTQVVWKGTSQIGGAISPDGRFVVVNYFPAGNMAGEFKANVGARS